MSDEKKIISIILDNLKGITKIPYIKNEKNIIFKLIYNLNNNEVKIKEKIRNLKQEEFIKNDDIEYSKHLEYLEKNLQNLIRTSVK